MHDEAMHDPWEFRRFVRERARRGARGGRHGERRGHHGHHGRYADRARRGDVRAAVLLLLEEQPMHGYQLIQEISERSEGAWRPSAGAIYPALALLEDEGFVTIAAEGGRKLASLTDEGRAYLDENRESLGDPFAAQNFNPGLRDLRDLFGELFVTAKLAARNANDEQVAQVRALLVETKRELYRILAGDTASDEGDSGR